MHDRSNAVHAPAVPASRADTPNPELAMIQSEIARVDAAEEVDAFVCLECGKPVPEPERAQAYVFYGRLVHARCSLLFRLAQLEQRVDGLAGREIL